MVEVDGTAEACALEVPAMVAGPASRPRAVELEPPGDDPLAQRVGRAARVAVRPPRARLDRIEAVVTVAAKQPLEVAPADTALLCCGGHGQLC